MKAARTKSDDTRLAERARAAGPLDSGEARAIMIAAVVLTIFLYFIKLILLPFVLAGIIAYICTPILDWTAKRTQWQAYCSRSRCSCSSSAFQCRRF